MQSHAKILTTLLLILALFSFASAQEVGQLDKDFAQGGQLLGEFSHSLKQVSAMLSLPDGGTLVAGNVPAEGENRVWLSRFHNNGSIDRNFGFQGRLPLVELDHVNSLVARKEGGFLIGGSVFNGKDTDFAILCIDEVGMPVRSFGDNGLWQYDLKGAEQLVSLTLQQDGKIVAAGQGAPLRGQTTDYLVMQLLPGGVLDLNFGMDGLSRIDIGRYDQCRDLCIQPDGKILIAGNSKVREAYEMAMIRLLPNGMPDYHFGESGHRLIPVGIKGDFARSVALQEDGKILLAGHTQVAESDFDWLVLRLNADGSPDLKFGNLSIRALNLGKDDFLGGLGLQADGKILLGGTSDFEFSVARLHSDGRIDQGFGQQGIRKVTETALPPVYGSRFGLQEDGKLLLSGATQGDLAIARLNGCPVLPGLGEILQAALEKASLEELRITIASGFDVTARFERPSQPEEATRGGGSMAAENHIVAVAFLRMGKSHSIQVLVDAENHIHLFGEGKFLKTLTPRKSYIFGRI